LVKIKNFRTNLVAISVTHTQTVVDSHLHGISLPVERFKVTTLSQSLKHVTRHQSQVTQM
ncbi:MAG: hypothetical protein ACLPRH_06955, partial [Syntrophobacteraceae bacterium]